MFSISDSRLKLKGHLHTKKCNDKQDEDRTSYIAVYCPLITVVLLILLLFP